MAMWSTVVAVTTIAMLITINPVHPVNTIHTTIVYTPVSYTIWTVRPHTTGANILIDSTIPISTRFRICTVE